MIVLGISAYYHDSAAALVVNGEIIAAAHEERFTRKKHDASFPTQAVQYVLAEAGIELSEVTHISFYDKPYLKFERLLEIYHRNAPKSLKSFLSAIPVWIKEKLFMKKTIKDELSKIGEMKAEIYFPEHHLSHAASAFYPSPYEDAAILTIDGVGEWACTTLCHGVGNDITMKSEIHYPNSVGLLYSAFTYYTGFKVNSGEYKLMGLAPYGNPDSENVARFMELMKKHLVTIFDDGSIKLNMKYFSFDTGLRMTNDKAWTELFGIPPRKSETKITQVYMDMALAIQKVTEEIVILLAKTAQEVTGSENLVMAGGVALNSVANGKLLKENIFKNIWIQPAAGDAGGALGAALSTYYIAENNPRTVDKADAMKGSLLGPSFNSRQILNSLDQFNANYTYFESFDELCDRVAEKIAGGNVIGWFQGRMEYGPRALGSRSILGDARNPEMQKKMNLKIKFREGFRPFAPSVLAEDSSEYFDIDCDSPYMLNVVPIVEKRKKELPKNYNSLELYEKLYNLRSDIPAITHIDFSARLQTVSKEKNSRYHSLISAFKKLTGYGLVINTSFNVRGEPIVCTPADAYKCFLRTEMDLLVIGNYLFDKSDQKNKKLSDEWQELFPLD